MGVPLELRPPKLLLRKGSWYAVSDKGWIDHDLFFFFISLHMQYLTGLSCWQEHQVFPQSLGQTSRLPITCWKNFRSSHNLWEELQVLPQWEEHQVFL